MWKQVSPFTFRLGEREHACGAQCREPPVRIGGAECCPISRMRTGFAIDVVEVEEVVATRRARVVDPMEVRRTSC